MSRLKTAAKILLAIVAGTVAVIGIFKIPLLTPFITLLIGMGLLTFSEKSKVDDLIGPSVGIIVFSVIGIIFSVVKLFQLLTENWLWLSVSTLIGALFAVLCAWVLLQKKDV